MHTVCSDTVSSGQSESQSFSVFSSVSINKNRINKQIFAGLMVFIRCVVDLG